MKVQREKKDRGKGKWEVGKNDKETRREKEVEGEGEVNK